MDSGSRSRLDCGRPPRGHKHISIQHISRKAESPWSNDPVVSWPPRSRELVWTSSLRLPRRSGNRPAALHHEDRPAELEEGEGAQPRPALEPRQEPSPQSTAGDARVLPPGEVEHRIEEREAGLSSELAEI